MQSALITGITGQDGSYLTELLLSKGYVVHGLVRRASNTARQRLDHLTSDPNIYGNRLFLHYADMDDITTVRRLLLKINPSEIYHLAGQSHVGISFEIQNRPVNLLRWVRCGCLRYCATCNLDPSLCMPAAARSLVTRRTNLRMN